jgi:hypothetical protein
MWYAWGDGKVFIGFCFVGLKVGAHWEDIGDV